MAVLLCWALACSHSTDGQTGTSRAAVRHCTLDSGVDGGDSEPVPPSSVLSLPAGVQLESAALVSFSHMDIRDEVTCGAGTWANVGAGGVFAGNDVQATNIVSASQITLGHRTAVSGFIDTTLPIQLGIGATVDSSQLNESAQLLPHEEYPVYYDLDVAQEAGVDVSVSDVVSLQPGAYGSSVFDGLLKLSTGTYLFQSLTAGWGATLEIDDAAGPVVVHMIDNSSWAAQTYTLSGASPDLLLYYHGQQLVLMDLPVDLFVVAPRATLQLQAVAPGGTVVGTFLADGIVVRPQIDVVHRPLVLQDFFPLP